MRRTEECVRRLLDEIGRQRREFLFERTSFEEAGRRFEAASERVRSSASAEPEAVLGLLDCARDEMMRLRSEYADAWADRMRRWIEMAEELSREVSQQASLTNLGELSASVAHEIRNPLCGILLSVEVLQTKMDSGDSRAALLANLRHEAERMERVVNNLLHFARQYKPRRVRCDMTDLVTRSIESVQAHVARKQMQVQVWRPPDPCMAEVDADLVQQVFSNILLNSVDACSKDGRVDVRLATSDGPASVAVSFRDEGAGIRSDLLERIFEPFFTSKSNGIGLGLSVSRKIVEAHNGRIEVASELGKGATFTVVFPQDAAVAEARTAA